MRAHELISEAFPYAPGTEMPSHIIDLRDPNKGKGRRFKYKEPIKGKTHGYIQAPATYVVLMKDGSVIVYYWADHNIIPWSEVLQKISGFDTELQSDNHDIRAVGTGYLIARSREFAQWQGDRNKYSQDLKKVVQTLVDRGIATPSMPIWIGNTASAKGEHIGTVKKILSAPENPNRLVLFHGTSTVRYEAISQHGLQPMEFENRVWNNSSLDKVRPEHREDSIYLTASRPQAEYYAKKAVNVDRKRLGPSARNDARRKHQSLMQQIREKMARLERLKKMTPEEMEAEDAHRSRYSYGRYTPARIEIQVLPGEIERAIKDAKSHEFAANLNGSGKIEPVVLQITLSKKEFDKLMADDDHLRTNPDAKPEDWQYSLSHFGQVAFRGSIPPERIKVISKGEGQVSR